MAQVIQLRRGSTSEWSTADPVLAQGEIGVDINVNRFKIGTGLTSWNYLDYSAAFDIIIQSSNEKLVFPTFASATGISSVGIATEGIVYAPNSGNLGIGTTNPSSRLTISGDVNVTGIITANDFNSASDIKLKDNQEFKIGLLNFTTIFIPGHTNGHIAIYFEKEKIAFNWLSESRAYRTPRQLNGLKQSQLGEQLFEQLLALQILANSDPAYAARVSENIMKLQNWPGFRTSQPDLYNIIAMIMKPEKFKDRIAQDVKITIPRDMLNTYGSNCFQSLILFSSLRSSSTSLINSSLIFLIEII